MEERFPEILGAEPVDPALGRQIGLSREGRPVRAWRFGTGGPRISLLAGCHADEPVGPRLLFRLAGLLSRLHPDDPLAGAAEWWIVPHVNPDGAERNAAWQPPGADAYDIADFLAEAVREAPGDDIEFGFPRGPDDGARPENRAVWRWWRSAGEPFALHVSLHGLSFGAGPWFLLEPDWRDRTADLRERCRRRVRELGYELHDVDREGEKGFVRIERGFCTRPDSDSMRRHFLERDDPETAARFRPSSMEAIRALGGDPLTLVSEMPLFLTPGVGDELGPPDPVREAWRERVETWRARLADGESREVIRLESREAGLRPMPVRDQMRLQWSFIVAGLEAVSAGGR